MKWFCSLAALAGLMCLHCASFNRSAFSCNPVIALRGCSFQEGKLNFKISHITPRLYDLKADWSKPDQRIARLDAIYHVQESYGYRVCLDLQEVARKEKVSFFDVTVFHFLKHPSERVVFVYSFDYRNNYPRLLKVSRVVKR
ncbi:MAG: hypothetical protein HY602_02020 [Parcubacteria group bacterium]|nr:hypothetical protein [Parcubacteria group bacterium]